MCCVKNGDIKNIKANKGIDIISFIVAVLIMILVPILKTGNDVSEVNGGVLVVIFVMGVLSALAMIIPGISGSLVLMIFGYYILIIGNIKTFFESVIRLDGAGIQSSVLVLIVFAVGAILGLLLISKLIDYLFKKYPKTVYIAILGLLMASVFSIVYSTIKEYPDINYHSFWTYFFSIIMLVLGVTIEVVMTIINKKADKNKIKNKQE